MHDLVIFDCDGVLVDSEVLSNQALADNLAGYGLHLTLPECMSLFVGLTTAKCKEKAVELGANLPADWIVELDAETDALLQKGVPLIDGIPDLLSLLDRRSLPYCVASNGTLSKMKVTLGQNGLWDRFKDVMFSVETIGMGKPDPTLFLTAARQLGAASPIVIEDSPSGVTAAIRANMRCLGYAPHGGGERLRELGAEVFTQMSQVPKLLGL
ncbi:HAD family phosphatase [Ruegeria sp. 6PALISEP08]|uniref:HAD family hydrolase n=1 Tax=Ruegeria sp. 6PALISEP08 TaxID=1225660 RepID=UPI00067E9C9F|nr:HAD family phosphatase [Ruegeria sp. 6PALISEP08]